MTPDQRRDEGTTSRNRVIHCPCGYVVRAETEDDLVSQAMTHARESHQMDLTREQALAMARPA